MQKFISRRVLATMIFGLGVFRGHAAAVQPVVYSPHGAHFSVHMNMGPTGAAAWMRGYHFQVVSIAERSPADGRLQLGDLVIGANGVLFDAEAGHRSALGKAIGDAEASGEPLSLHVVRGEQERMIEILLPAMGAFAEGWPAGCEKSERILAAASRTIVNAQQPNGRIVTSGNMGTSWGGLLLLASGNPDYLDAARRAAYQVATVEYPGIDLNNWAMGYGGILLAEYYLATGDDAVLEALAGIADELVRGQMKSGSWGHKSPGQGYGNLNQPGITCALALVLARECGIAVDETAIDKALDFFGRFAQTGNIPYGDHMPGEAPDNNGTSASAAVLMHLGGRKADAVAFARSVGLSYWARELGHTGGFWSIAWGPLAAALASADEQQTFMAEQAWYYNLSRTWQGGLVLLPYFEALTRFDSSNYIESGPAFTTAGMALAFALPHQRLRILGAAQSVFSPHTDLHDAVRTLRDQYLARDWDAFDAGLAALDPEDLVSEIDRRGYAQLAQARSDLLASLDRTIMEIESNLDQRHGFLASQQFEALQRGLGEAADPRLADLAARFAEGGVAWNVREGQRFWDAWETLKVVSTMAWTAQGQWARALLEPMPSLRPPVWERLAATEAYGAQPWRTKLLAPDATLPTGWEQPDFDDTDWLTGERILLAGDPEVESNTSRGGVAARRAFQVADTHGVKLRVRLRTVRPAQTRVYLNGSLVVDVVRGQRGGYVFLELDDAALDLLQTGENWLAVMSPAQGSGGNRLDVGLDMARHLPQREHLRIDRTQTVPPVTYDELDDTLRVREARQRAEAAFQALYDAKSRDALLEALADPVPYIRHVAGNALVRRGQDAIEAALALADHPDWRVRSTVCHIIQKAGRYRQGDHEALAALLDEQIPLLTRMLSDEHAWVRVRAAIAVRTYDELATPALPELTPLVDDEDDWVRLNAIRSIRRISDDPVALVRAAVALLQHPYAGYPAPRAAFDALQQYADADDLEPHDPLPALLSLLQNPPEGDGRFLLNQVMDMAAELDPEGDALIPVLMEAAADETHMSRLRQNPRGHAMGILGAYGEKAGAAIPVLEGILASEDDRRWHDDARQALDGIRGGERENIQ